jgi:hypothetical protein
MSGRIGKYPPIGGLGQDFHQVMPPSVPPPPPAPPTPAPIPRAPWVHMIATPISGQVYTGKYTSISVGTEGMGNIIWGHDWGPLQIHLPLPPILATPSLGLLPLASQSKYFLPAFSVKEPIDGAVAGGATPVAISTPAFFIQQQTCQDLAGWGFVAPFGISFQMVSTHWVGFTLGDLLAGFIGMAGDALGNLVLSGAGNAMGIPSTVGGAVAGAVINNVVTVMGLGIGTLDENGQKGAVALAVTATGGLFGIGVAVGIGYGAGLAANAVGDAWQPPPAPAPAGGGT